MNTKVKVLNITGCERSGSTIISKLLGEIDGFFYGGELRNIWSHSLIDNKLCSCNVLSQECSIWSEVFTKAFNGYQIDALKMRDLISLGMRTRLVPLTFVGWGKEILKNRLKECIENLRRLYLSIQSVTGCSVIVDSTKASPYLYLLEMIDEIDLYVVHLIRDSRAVAYSWKRKKLQPEKKDKAVYMKQYTNLKGSISWNVRNLTAEVFSKSFPGKYMKLRYEDFIEKPKESVQTILNFVNEKRNSLPFVDEHTVKLGVSHGVWGNPGRFESGNVQLKKDEEWKEKMKPTDKFVLTALTLPLLLKYKY